MNKKQFWDRVNELLDGRLDPFEDQGVQDFLREQQGQAGPVLEELERLTGRLAVLDRVPTASRKLPIAKMALVAAGLIGLLILPKLLRNSESTQAPVDHLSQAEPAASSHSRIESYCLSVSDSGPFGERTTTVEDGRVSRFTSNGSSDSRLNRMLFTVIRSPRRLP